jgi:hypothetical protein
MATCPCCGPKWSCWSCCCPDGSDAPQSVTLQLSNYRLEYPDPNNLFQFDGMSVNGTYTLNRTLEADPMIDPPAHNNTTTCVRYLYRSGQQSQCQTTVGNDTKMLFVSQFFQFRSGILTRFNVAFSGKDSDGVCMWFGSVFTGSPSYIICDGQAGSQTPEVQFRLQVNKPGIARPFFVLCDVALYR